MNWEEQYQLIYKLFFILKISKILHILNTYDKNSNNKELDFSQHFYFLEELFDLISSIEIKERYVLENEIKSFLISEKSKKYSNLSWTNIIQIIDIFSNHKIHLDHKSAHESEKFFNIKIDDLSEKEYEIIKNIIKYFSSYFWKAIKNLDHEIILEKEESVVFLSYKYYLLDVLSDFDTFKDIVENKKLLEFKNRLYIQNCEDMKINLEIALKTLYLLQLNLYLLWNK